MNPSRLAGENPFYQFLHYSTIEPVAPGLEMDVLKRCTDLNEILANSDFRGEEVLSPVQDIQRFLATCNQTSV